MKYFRHRGIVRYLFGYKDMPRKCYCLAVHEKKVPKQIMLRDQYPAVRKAARLFEVQGLAAVEVQEYRYPLVYS